MAQSDPKTKGEPSEPVKPVVIGVLGDSLGDGLWAGLYRVLRRNKKFSVIKMSKVSSGLTQSHYFDWVKTAKTITKESKFHIAVVFLGANDQQALKHDKKWHRFRSPEWTEIYSGRISKMIKELKKKGLEVFWVGLPVMQKDSFDAGAQFLNGLYSKAAAKQNVPYIGIRQVTAGENGKYATHYKNRKGKMRLMRANDGVHFTMSGYVEIAAHVFGRIQEIHKQAKKKKKRITGAGMGRGVSQAQGAARENPKPPR